MREFRYVGIVWLLALLTFNTAAAQQGREIRLVLQVVVDGLRGDLLHRYVDGFGEDGFAYLMRNGSYYSNAHYQHANTETIVGHTTLATGTHPSQHGMIGNVWFDREARELSYNIEDPDAPLLPTREQSTTGEQVDPAQNLARTSGRSPRAIQVPTLGDGLAAYNGGRSKVFAVSGKDRSAVSMAGQVGKAFWFSTDNGDFVTSRYYYDDYPAWARAWNEQRKADSFAGTEWRLLDDSSSYLLAAQDDRPYEVDLKGYGRTFPHRFGEADGKLLYTHLLVSPVGDELLFDFSRELVVNEGLGQDAFPDYLSIRFSGMDAVNHFFGPSSLENEVVLRRLDTTLAELFLFIDEAVGLQHTLIVLAADHGMADMPEYMTELGYAAGRLNPGDIVERANQVGDKLGIEKIVRFFYRPYLYLNDEKIAEAGLDFEPVEQAVANALTDHEGINLAVSSSQLPAIHPNPLVEKVRRNEHVTRSGDIYVIQEPYWFLFDEGPVASMHGSPWAYDTHVPIIFSGPGIAAQRSDRPIHPVDVAPTIASILGMTVPASTQGSPLVEVLQ